MHDIDAAVLQLLFRRRKPAPRYRGRFRRVAEHVGARDQLRIGLVIRIRDDVDELIPFFFKLGEDDRRALPPLVS